MLFHKFVLTTPGLTLFTRIGASSTAAALTNPSIAPHIADANAQPLPGRVLAIPLVRLMDPPGLIRGAPYFTAAKAPQKRMVKNSRALSISALQIAGGLIFSPAVNTSGSKLPVFSKNTAM